MDGYSSIALVRERSVYNALALWVERVCIFDSM